MALTQALTGTDPKISLNYPDGSLLVRSREIPWTHWGMPGTQFMLLHCDDASSLLVILLNVMWLPASIGILISEACAVRSWMFHAGNGAVSAWLGWSLFGYVDDSRIPLNQPLAVIAAGLAGGFAYWAIARWSAGFWKPVFRAGAASHPSQTRQEI